MAELIKKQNRYLHKVHAISFINIGSLEGSFRQNEENGRGGIKRKSVAAIEETGEVSNKKSTGEEWDNSSSTGENDTDTIQVEDISMGGEQDGENENIISESGENTTNSQGNGGDNAGGDEGDDDI